KNILIMWSCLLENARKTGHFSMSLHILLDSTLQILCCDPHNICNDEGKLIGLPWNRPLFDDDGHICDVIAGTFLVVGLSEDDFDSLTDGQIDKFTEVFRQYF
ncbi:MAG: DUF3846 domain-containing protein, partial [Clostridia bacterium]|nr:DUF3846 domain-containing protein [Clostridia bacterium]